MNLLSGRLRSPKCTDLSIKPALRTLDSRFKQLDSQREGKFKWPHIFRVRCGGFLVSNSLVRRTIYDKITGELQLGNVTAEF
jgi:hypothetical protein